MALNSRSKQFMQRDVPEPMDKMGKDTVYSFVNAGPWVGDIWGATKTGPTLDGLQVVGIDPTVRPGAQEFGMDAGPKYL